MNTFIITAGGVGKRMKTKIPKQFLLLKGKPILMHTITCFYDFDNDAQIILTLPSDWWDYWEELCRDYDFTVKHEIEEGGKERFHSIQKALKKAKGDIIGVHDGVRPLVSQKTIKDCIEKLENHKAVIPVLPLKESLRKGSPNRNQSADRKNYFTVQTPQCFYADIIKNAYDTEFQEYFTDDASVVEESGGNITMIIGNEENIKITSPMDLKVAEVLIR